MYYSNDTTSVDHICHRWLTGTLAHWLTGSLHCLLSGTLAGPHCLLSGHCVAGPHCLLSGHCVAGPHCLLSGQCVAGPHCLLSGQCVAGPHCLLSGQCVAGPWIGGASMAKTEVGGDNLGEPIPHDYLRPVQQEAESGVFIMPYGDGWGSGAVLTTNASS